MFGRFSESPLNKSCIYKIILYTMIKRKEQKIEDTWKLDDIFSDIAGFDAAMAEAVGISQQIKYLEGKLKDSKAVLELMSLDDKLGILMEKLGGYAYMKVSEDGSNQENQALYAKYVNFAAQISEKLSFVVPDLMELGEDKLRKIIDDEKFAQYKVYLSRLLRERKHVLSKPEERLMSLQSPVGGMFSQGFDDLTDVDFKFQSVGGKELTNSTFGIFLRSGDQKIRRDAYLKYYKRYDEYKHLIARLYEGSIRQNIFTSKARGYDSVLDRSLYADDVTREVYLNLIQAAHKGFDSLHRFYEIKRKALGLNKLNHYDVYAPIVPDFKKTTSYDEACRIVRDALAPLGKDYQDTIYKGITIERWVDRYENEGKASGAYSNGAYKTLPYIMMNYKEDHYRDIFTLAHEGGHSMHSYYSVRNNPFSCYDYSIFEAEVASTFNERLLSRYLYDNASSDEEKLYLLANEADDIVATFFRQTMFAEFEHKIYSVAENGNPVTLDVITKTYGKLLRQYFGSNVGIVMSKASLEALRIPHFYRPFYVYKYATGITAAILLSEKVLAGGDDAREDYLAFLKRGGSLFPLDNLRKVGADLNDSRSYEAILNRFNEVLDKIEELLNKGRF